MKACYLNRFSADKIKDLLKNNTYQYIADLLGCSRQAIYLFSKTHGFWKHRGPGSQKFKLKQRKYDDDKIVNLVKQGKSSVQIKKLLGCSKPIIHRAAREHGVKLRTITYKLQNKKWLYKLYITDRLTILQISKITKNSAPAVSRYLKKFKIKTRRKGRRRNESR